MKNFSINGVKIATTSAGIRKKNRKDLSLFLLDEGTNVAGVFTQNKFCAAPVQICQKHLKVEKNVRALLINTGIANAGCGEEGLNRALLTCQELAKSLNLKTEQILPFSTGVIMENLPADKIIQSLPNLINNLDSNNWQDAAFAILTTDLTKKLSSRQIEINGKKINITGISKGSGMIKPNMATMLGFIATDAKISADLMQDLIQELADSSFNKITVDGDTSTNDSFILMATNKADNEIITSWQNDEAQKLKSALLEVSFDLARKIIQDGEGATKFITIKVEQGKNKLECRQIANSIAHSPLVKTAFFASDPNLGRILAAIGYSGIEDLDVNKIELFLDEVKVAENGGRYKNYQEEDGKKVMNQKEILVRVILNRGSEEDFIWTCDLSYDYVKINAEYRS